LQRLLGRQKVSATLDVYGDLCYEDLDAVAGRLVAATGGFGRVALGYRLTRSNFVVLRRALSNPSAPLIALINPSGDERSNEEISALPQFNEVDPRRYQMNRRLNSADVTQLAELYRGGKSMRELANKFGIHRVTVSRLLKQAGVELRNRGLAASEIDRAVELYAQGKCLTQIGEHFGVDHGTVWRQLRKRGVRMRNTHGRPT